MSNILNKIFLKSPFFIKRVFCNAEALRRNMYRRYGDFNSVVKDIDFQNYMYSNNESNDENVALKRLKDLISYAIKNIPYYQALNLKNITCLENIKDLPVLSKENIRKNKELFISKSANKKDLWNGSTSGSTGTPLKFYKDRESVRYNQALYDCYCKSLDCDLNKKRIRISGIKICPYSRNKPPFWVYVDLYKQLQCSAYHLSPNTCKYYIKKFIEFNAEFGTGIPSAWNYLADYILENSIEFSVFKAIITDSEAMSTEQEEKIARAFNCPVYQTYGLGEVGMVAVQCKNKHYHTLPKMHIVEILDEDNNLVPDGIEGQIVITDLNSMKFPFIRYKTGDLGIMRHDDCGCGIKKPYLTNIVGRVEDYILTKDNRKIRRVTLIVKPAIGIKESQIIQFSRDAIIIKVVPDVNFDEKSMEEVVKNAPLYIGDMNVKWEKVQKLERTANGKLKFLIRKI